jgi:hypothetical protein
MSEALNQSVAAELAGVSARRLRQLSQSSDPPPQDSSGRYPVREFGAWLRSRKSGGSADGSGGDPFQRRAFWQSELARQKFMREAGNLIGREEHIDCVTTVAKITVRGLVTLPDRLERDKRVAPDVVEYVADCINDLRDEIASAVAVGDISDIDTK